MRRTILTVLAATCFGVFAQSALASGGSFTFVGGTAGEQATVRSALDASSFDWGLIPSTITFTISPVGTSYSTYGHVFIDPKLLDAGRFSWGVVQHEMAHQVDFFLLDDTKRTLLEQRLGGQDWCYSIPGPRPFRVRLRALRIRARVGVFAIDGQLDAPGRLNGRGRGDAGGSVPHAAGAAPRRAERGDSASAGQGVRAGAEA